MISTDTKYDSLQYVLHRAFLQASAGKGKERHAQDLPFTEQPMQSISALLGSHKGLQYQAIKKIQESNRLPHERAVAEMLGAINYIAGAIIYMEMHHAEVEQTGTENQGSVQQAAGRAGKTGGAKPRPAPRNSRRESARR